MDWINATELEPFFVPALTGLGFALLLPLLGMYLHLRDEWLAALAFAQTAAAGALLAMYFGGPLILGGLSSTAIAVVLKNTLEHTVQKLRSSIYALVLLSAWSTSILLAANLPLAERLGHALFDGQLYFTGPEHLASVLLALLLVVSLLYPLSRRLLIAHCFPDLFKARAYSAGLVHSIFDTLVAFTLTLATMSIGIMAAFSLTFVPPFITWTWSKNWKQAKYMAVIISILSYSLAFYLAMHWDQPFGPTMALTLTILGIGSLLLRKCYLKTLRTKCV